jgi:PKD repeat protein
VIHQYQQPGAYKVKLKAINPNTCNKKDSVVKIVNFFKPEIEVSDDVEICEGTTFQLTASGASVYNWTSDNSFNSSNPSPVVQPPATTQYFVTATDGNGCIKKDTVQVSVLDSVNLKWERHWTSGCITRPSIIVRNLTPPADDVAFHFDFGDGTTSAEVEVEHIYERDSLYSLKLVALKKFCSFEEAVQLPVYTLFVPNVFTPETSPGFNDNFEIGFGPNRVAPSSIDLTLQLSVVDRWGKKVFESSDYKNDWNAEGLAGGVYYIQLKVGDLASCKNWVHIVK